MNQELPDETPFLNALYQTTSGDPSNQASMYDIGTSLGLDADTAGEIAQNLCIKGLAELKTLSGDVGITADGLKALNIKVTPDLDPTAFSLGAETHLNQDRQGLVLEVIEEIKSIVGKGQNAYPAIEALVIDIKTAEIQLLSPNPHTAVIKALLAALLSDLKNQAPDELRLKLEAMIA